MGLIAATAFLALQLTVAYCVDSYYALSSEAIVTVILVRNSMSFAVGYSITPWIEIMRLQNAFLVAGFVGMAQTALFFIFTTWGKRMREASVDSYWRFVTKVRRETVGDHAVAA